MRGWILLLATIVGGAMGWVLADHELLRVPSAVAGIPCGAIGLFAFTLLIMDRLDDRSEERAEEVESHGVTEDAETQ